jgi:hypothetical protein
MEQLEQVQIMGQQELVEQLVLVQVQELVEHSNFIFRKMNIK